VTPEAGRFLQKAQKHLERASTMIGVNLNEDAGRAAYLAGFHAAQAFIFENIGKVFKSHKGVQSEFLRLTKDDSRFPSDLRGFLSRAYNLKAIADYETGPGSEVSAERAMEAVETGKNFVTHIAGLIPTAKLGPRHDNGANP
jgi:uncharacterized protein (UPF0332 family)